MTGEFTPTLEIRSSREFSAGQGRSYLLDLPMWSADQNDDENNENGKQGLQQDQGDGIVNEGQEGLQNAYNFMQLRRKRVKTQAGSLINSLRLGGAVTQDSEKSVGHVYKFLRVSP